MRSREVIRGAFLGLLLAAFAYGTFLLVQPFLTFLLAAVLLAFALAPVQRRLAARVDERVAALALVGAAVAGLLVPAALLIATVPADATRLSRAAERILASGRIDDRLEAALGVDLPVQSVLSRAPRRAAELVVGDASSLLGDAVHAVLGLTLLLFVLYYLLKDGPEFVAWATEMTPLRPAVRDELYAEAEETTWAVLEGHVLVAIVQGVVAGIGLLVVGIPNVAFWTVVMMFLELFPIVGVAAVLGPAALYLLFVGRPLAAGFLVLYGLSAVTLVDDYLRALVVDRESSLHSSVILVGVFGGVYVFGVMGLFFGPIVLGVFATLVRLVNEYYLGEA